MSANAVIKAFRVLENGLPGMLEACERQVIAGQDGADTLLRRDKEILGAQLVHNDSIFGRFYRDSSPKADKLLHARHFWAPPEMSCATAFAKRRGRLS